jgi:hypothetical protein
VDPSRIEELIADWLAESKQAKATAPSKAEAETQTHAAQAQTEVVASPIGPKEASGSNDPTMEDLEVAANKSSPPPPPPGLSNSRERDMKFPPPPPPKTTDVHKTPTGATRAIVPAVVQSTGFHRGGQGEAPGSAALWITIAAFLTALVLGLFALTIAWASGAFDRNRAERPNVTPAFVQCQERLESITRAADHRS